MITLGVLGTGDVAFRTYLPGLASLRGRAAVVACADPVAERAARFAAEAEAITGEPVTAYATLEDMLAHPGLDAVLNLSPAPAHFATTKQILEAGKHCYEEKPIANTLEDGRALEALAKERGLVLLCAPAPMASSRFRWLKEAIGELIGEPHLAIGQMANLGPAAWKEYAGDPAVFYTEKVGPLLDTGVYLLHAMTGLFGPVARVSASGGIAMRERLVTIPARYGETIEVTANDVMLLNLEWADGKLGHILSSFAVPRTTAPVLELHGAGGSIQIKDIPTWYDLAAPIDLLRLDRRNGAPYETWTTASPPDVGPVRQPIQSGPLHFVTVLEGGEDPILTPAHAIHVLEIIGAAGLSAREHRAVMLETTF